MAEIPADAIENAEHGHEHPKHLAHHFDTPQQQFDSGKLGIWLFLTTEILLFSGMFCAYSVYRANHPEIFLFAHHYLDKVLGGINTVVLICSSLTMAWGVRCAQLSQKKGLIICLMLTLGFAGVFLVIKGIEYSSKYEHGVFWFFHGGNPLYEPTHPPSDVKVLAPQAAAPAAAAPAAAAAVATTQYDSHGFVMEQSKIPPGQVGPAGIANTWLQRNEPKKAEGEEEIEQPNNVHIFFSIYFVMTGLHGLHVVGGMVVIFWCLLRAMKGEFDKDYFSPIDYVGLYWHLVDLIWIFLFPLLYLIK
jgi:cytochrome c oxidase subunit III